MKSMVASHSSQDMARNYDYVLEVRPVDRAPFQATLRHSAAFLAGKPQEYDEVKVKYDPKSLKVIFDFTGDPRFDVDAMNARTAQMRKETAEMLAARKQVLASYADAPHGQETIRDVLSKFTMGEMSSMPMVINAVAERGDSGSPDAQAAKLIGLAKMVETGLLSREQFEEMKLRILGTNE